MQKSIEAVLSQIDGKWSIYAKNLITNNVIYEINANDPMPAASIGKLQIALFVFSQVAKDEISFKDKFTLAEEVVLGGSGVLKRLDLGLELTLLDVVKLMLIVSDNTAAKMLVKKFTPQKINEYIASLGFKVTSLKIDGDKFGFGMTTAKEMSDLLEGLYTANYFSKELSEQFIDILKQCEDSGRIKRYIPHDRYKEEMRLEVANKGGSIPGVRSDVGIVFEKEPYTICILSKDLSDDSYNVDNAGTLAAAKISKVIYDNVIAGTEKKLGKTR